MHFSSFLTGFRNSELGLGFCSSPCHCARAPLEVASRRAHPSPPLLRTALRALLELAMADGATTVSVLIIVSICLVAFFATLGAYARRTGVAASGGGGFTQM